VPADTKGGKCEFAAFQTNGSYAQDADKDHMTFQQDHYG